jgi:uncharacterized protein YrzB (UPF0473 family)
MNALSLASAAAAAPAYPVKPPQGSARLNLNIPTKATRKPQVPFSNRENAVSAASRVALAPTLPPIVRAEKEELPSYDNLVFTIGGLAAIVKKTNQVYQNEVSLVVSEEKASRFKAKIEEEHERFKSAHNKKEILAKQTEAAVTNSQHSIKEKIYQQLCLREMVIGNKRMVKMAGFKFESRYGLPYRLYQIEQELSRRSAALGLSADEIEQIEIPEEEGNESLLSKILRYSHKLTVSKEYATIVNHALAELEDRQIALASYLGHMHHLDNCKKALAALKERKDQELKGLESEINIESVKKDSPLVPGLVQEKTEIEIRWAQIEHRAEEIETLLRARRSAFQFTDSELNDSSIRADNPEFSFNPFTKFVQDVVAVKEDITLEAKWEGALPLASRKIALAAGTKKMKALVAANLEIQKQYAARVTKLNEEIALLKASVSNLKSEQAQAERLLADIRIDLDVRNGWDLNKPEEVSAAAAGSSSGGLLSSLYTGLFGSASAAPVSAAKNS